MISTPTKEPPVTDSGISKSLQRYKYQLTALVVGLVFVVVSNYTELAIDDSSEDPGIAHSLAVIREATDRGKELTRRILLFSRGGTGERHPLNIVPVIADAMELIRATMPNSISIYQEIESDEMVVNANVTEINQVVMNLCTNSGHAMRQSGGTLSISLNQVEAKESVTANHILREAGRYVLLRIEDNGEGMAHDTIAKIYTPFFSTKKAGEGTGLGLSVIYGIVESYGGYVDVSSNIGQGTVFDIYLPISEDEIVESVHEDDSVITGSEHILFVDDEPAIVDFTVIALGRMGYEVTSTTDSFEAVKLFEATPSAFDLVITDFTMPGMNGLLLAQKIKAIRSNVPVLMLSGQMDLMSDNDLGQYVNATSAKPVRIKQLGSDIRSLLDGVASP